MKLFLCLVLLFVAVRAQIEIGPIEEDKQDPFWPEVVPDEDGNNDEGIYMGEDPAEDDDDDDDEDDNKADDDDDDDDEDDDDDDDPTTPSPTKSDECMKKLWECKRNLKPYSCEGKLKCYEEKSQCYKARRANNPNMPTKSPAKKACKTKFEGCIANAGDKCMSKLRCYKEKKMCYNKKPWGHHGRRRHHHRRRHHRNPKALKCKVSWAKCVMRARSCPDRLKCFWTAKKCMKEAWPKHSTTAMPPTTEPEMDNDDDEDKVERRRRRWDPKVMAECKTEFKKCINSTDDCRKKIGCFFGMKRCMMERHRPTPCPRMMKCKMEYKNCSSQAKSCDERLQCKMEMHKCMQEMRPTGTPPPTTDRPEYGRRRRWDPKRKEKCVMLLEKCLNETSSCPEKMKCFWKMKKCLMPGGGVHKMSPYHLKMQLNKFKTHVHGIIMDTLQRARMWFHKKRQGMRKWGQERGQGWQKWGQEMRKRGQERGQGMHQWGKGMGQRMRKWGQERGHKMRKWGQERGQKMRKWGQKLKRKGKEMKRKWQQKRPSWLNRQPWSG